MGQVNRIPKGFLDLIGAQQQGKNPPIFSDAVAPIIDLTSLYLGQTLGVHQTSFSTTVPGNGNLVSVPQDETWLLLSGGIWESAGAGGEWSAWEWTIQSTPRPDATGVRQATIAVSPRVTNNNAGEILAHGFNLGQPLLLQPGVQIFTRIMERDGTPARTANLTFLIYRLES